HGETVCPVVVFEHILRGGAVDLGEVIIPSAPLLGRFHRQSTRTSTRPIPHSRSSWHGHFLMVMSFNLFGNELRDGSTLEAAGKPILALSDKQPGQDALTQ